MSLAASLQIRKRKCPAPLVLAPEGNLPLPFQTPTPGRSGSVTIQGRGRRKASVPCQNSPLLPPTHLGLLLRRSSHRVSPSIGASGTPSSPATMRASPWTRRDGSPSPPRLSLPATLAGSFRTPSSLTASPALAATPSSSPCRTYCWGCYVIAVDIDPKKVALARNNARVYGVEDRIEFITGDFFQLGPSLKGDVAFLSPPWGGPEYRSIEEFTLDLLKPKDGYTLFQFAQQITTDIIMFLLRNVDVNQVEELSWLSSPPLEFEVQLNYVNNYLKGITVYYGDLASVYAGAQLKTGDHQGVNCLTH